MVPARQQNVAIKAHAAGHAGGLDKAGNAECGVANPRRATSPAAVAAIAATTWAGQRAPWKDHEQAL